MYPSVYINRNSAGNCKSIKSAQGNAIKEFVFFTVNQKCVFGLKIFILYIPLRANKLQIRHVTLMKEILAIKKRNNYVSCTLKDCSKE